MKTYANNCSRCDENKLGLSRIQKQEQYIINKYPLQTLLIDIIVNVSHSKAYMSLVDDALKLRKAITQEALN